ncbi:CFEM domain protein [Ceratobasidium sp. AG-Ba]|nr:CFEM domain protein [Ceratobasidium sp. AG-Ba]
MFHRLSFVVLTLFLSFFSVVYAAEFPTCAQSCLGQASIGNCSPTDNVCMCNNTSYTNATNDCFRTSCSAADWKTAYDQSSAMCAAVGVTKPNVLNPPTKREFTPVYYGRRAVA